MSEEFHEDESNVPAVVNFSEASTALNTLKNYVYQIDYSQSSLKALLNFKKNAFSLFYGCQRQTYITYFFEKI